MMEFNEHQLGLWHGMLKSIADFRRGKSQYFEFVGALEGALDAGEFRDEILVGKWYDFWTPLETVRAQKGNSVTVEEVSKYLSDMETFLSSVIPEE